LNDFFFRLSQTSYFVQGKSINKAILDYILVQLYNFCYVDCNHLLKTQTCLWMFWVRVNYQIINIQEPFLMMVCST